jgi:hypothetical protein
MHLYGLTETYGPFAVCAWNADWDAKPVSTQARLRARQGVATIVSEALRVVDADMRVVPRDRDTLGEVVMHRRETDVACAVAVTAHAYAQPLQWNIGNVHRYALRALSPASAMTPRLCSYAPRCDVITPLGPARGP